MILICKLYRSPTSVSSTVSFLEVLGREVFVSHSSVFDSLSSQKLETLNYYLNVVGPSQITYLSEN